MDLILSVVKHILGIRWRYMLHGSYIYIEPGSSLVIGHKVRIRHSRIVLQRNAKLRIADEVTVSYADITVSSGYMEIGRASVVGKGMQPVPCKITVTGQSKVLFGAYNRIRPRRIWVRFGATLSFGEYVNLNEYSEVRCDESIRVGNYVDISYFVRIWDTNTHEFEPLEQRRERWRRTYLKRDVSEKPETKPVVIGNDTWIGEHCAILKGTVIGDGCICGYGTLISNKTIPAKTVAVSRPELRLMSGKL